MFTVMMLTSIRQLANHKKFKALLDTYKGPDAERFVDACFDETRGQKFTRMAAAEVRGCIILMSRVLIELASEAHLPNGPGEAE